jgi:hypothetical protein
MTKWQWKVIMALVKYVLFQRGNDWISFNVNDELVLFEALNGREE